MIQQASNSDIQRALTSIYPMYPIFDVEESETHYVLCLDGRFIQGTEIDIELIDGELVIRGRGDTREGDKISVKDVVVRSHGQNVATQYRDGLLIIALPKENYKRISFADFEHEEMLH